MSEYQYYEFRAIDRVLSDRQMQELRAISTRAAISRTSFSNCYTYGDLKANPSDVPSNSVVSIASVGPHPSRLLGICDLG
jgi:hypothetical protein